MSMLDGDLMLIVWRRQRELGRTPPRPVRPVRFPRLKPLEIHPFDHPWPVLRGYPYGQVS